MNSKERELEAEKMDNCDYVMDWEDGVPVYVQTFEVVTGRP